MNEHLFKLKKDGKTVGYEKHSINKLYEDANGKPTIIIEHSNSTGVRWYPVAPKYYGWKNYIRHDEKYPFVTKDKNGKDVFEGDKVFVFYKIPCEVIWWDIHKGWAVRLDKNPDGLPMPLSNCYPKDIELIEGKEND